VLNSFERLLGDHDDLKFFSFLVDAEGKQSYAVHWEPPPEEVYEWRFGRPKVKGSLRIYESHVGISGSEQKVTSFQEFTSKVFSGLLFFVYFIVILNFISGTFFTTRFYLI
jgi:hypothetical protein